MCPNPAWRASAKQLSWILEIPLASPSFLHNESANRLVCITLYNSQMTEDKTKKKNKERADNSRRP